MSSARTSETNDELVFLDARDSARGTSLLDEITSRQSAAVPPAVKVALDPVLIPCGCKSPAIATMDYMKHSPDDWQHPEPRINRVCTRCWTHWFGSPAKVRQFTKAEWDKQMEAA